MMYTKEYMLDFVKCAYRQEIGYFATISANESFYILKAYHTLGDMLVLFGPNNVLKDTTPEEVAYIVQYSTLYPTYSLPYCVLLERLLV